MMGHFAIPEHENLPSARYARSTYAYKHRKNLIIVYTEADKLSVCVRVVMWLIEKDFHAKTERYDFCVSLNLHFPFPHNFPKNRLDLTKSKD